MLFSYLPFSQYIFNGSRDSAVGTLGTLSLLLYCHCPAEESKMVGDSGEGWGHWEEGGTCRWEEALWSAESTQLSSGGLHGAWEKQEVQNIFKDQNCWRDRVMDSVVGFALGGLPSSSQSRETRWALTGLHAQARWIWEQGVPRSSMEGCLHLGWDDFKEKSFDFFLGFIYIHPLSERVF